MVGSLCSGKDNQPLQDAASPSESFANNQNMFAMFSYTNATGLNDNRRTSTRNSKTTHTRENTGISNSNVPLLKEAEGT
jgi:hypothetical protein